MIKKILYIVSLLSLVVLTILTIDMLPFIFKLHLQGFIFLFLVILLLIIELFLLIKYKKVLKNNISYNLFIILIALYATLIYYKIYSSGLSFLYSLDVDYLRRNYSLLDVAFIIVFFDLWLIIGETKKKK